MIVVVLTKDSKKNFKWIDIDTEGQKGDKGDKGDDGKDGENGLDGHTPVKGIDYFDGTNGYTPIKNIDYFDGAKGDKGDSFQATNNLPYISLI